MSIVARGCQTYSKHPSRYPNGSPERLIGASGCWVSAKDGVWLDYVAALGPVILGYADRDVDGAAWNQISSGLVSSSLPSELEERVAQLIVDYVPSAESVAFGKNGMDATMAAVRIARAHTGRDLVLTCGYHGAGDWFQCGRGIPYTYTHSVFALARWVGGAANTWSADDLQNAVDEFKPAALIMEPVVHHPPQNMPDPEHLEAVRKICTEHGVILIFDEMITAFRLDLGGAQSVYNVTPDLTCLGKAMGNGWPISAVCGRKDLMDLLTDGVFYSTTFAGECVSLAAAEACLKKLYTEKVPIRLAHYGAKLSILLNERAKEIGLTLMGYPQRISLKWADPENERIFGETLAKHKILYGGYFNLMLAHTTDHRAWELTERAITEAMELCR